MKIVMISASFVPSTAANSIQVMKVANALTALGHEVNLIVPGEPTLEWNELSNWYGLSTKFNISWLKENLRWRRYDFALKAVRHARKLHPDLVYTWMLQAATFSLWCRMPVIMELHDRIQGCFAPLLFSALLKSPTQKRLLFITQALRDIFYEPSKLSVTDEVARVAPMGIEHERYAALPEPDIARKQLSLPQGLTVGYSGHFYPGRGMEILLHLAETFPGVNFLWVGGTQQSVLEWREKLAEKAINNVTLTGFVPNQDIALYQAASEILLMPYGQSISGSSGGNTVDICSPMKMFEYMAAGRAIISSDLLVLHEVLNNQNAIFCPANDPAAWQAALVALIQHPEQIQSLSMQARLDSQAYSWKQRQVNALSGFLE